MDTPTPINPPPAPGSVPPLTPGNVPASAGSGQFVTPPVRPAPMPPLPVQPVPAPTAVPPQPVPVPAAPVAPTQVPQSPVQPPVNPSASEPPPVAVSPAVSLPVPEDSSTDEDADLEALSPQRVLRKGPSAGTVPVTPQTVSQPTGAQPRTFSIVQSQTPAPQPVAPAVATDPAEQFILPRERELAPQPAPVPAAPPVSVAQPPRPAAAPPVPAAPIPPRPQPPRPAPMPPRPAQVEPAAVPKAAEAAKKESAQPAAGAKRRSGAPLIAGAGLIVALALLGGGGYVLASSGTRLPYLYTAISGLPGDGVEVSKAAIAYVGGRDLYQAYGDLTVKDSADAFSIATSITADAPLVYGISDDSQLAKVDMSFDSASSVTAYYSKRGGSEGTWTFNLPSNVTDPLVAVSNADLAKTAAYPALAPVPLEDLLKSVKAEISYQKLSGQKVAHYAYDLNPSLLAKYLPEGATLSSPKAEAYYAWESAQPMRTVFDASISYEGSAYKVQQKIDYQNWDVAWATGLDARIDTLLAGTSNAKPTVVQRFIPMLGVTFASVPSSLAPLAEAVVPTGETVSAVASAPITAVPSLPAKPATSEAKARDTQRLSDLADLQKALEAYKEEAGTYPNAASLQQTGSSSTLFNALVPTYLTKMPVDPLKDTYWYEYLSDGSKYTLRSVAEDSLNAKAKAGKAFSYFEVTNP